MYYTRGKLIQLGGIMKKNSSIDLTNQNIFLPTQFSSPPVSYRCDNNPDWTMKEISDSCQLTFGVSQIDMLADTITFGSLIHDDDVQRTWSIVQTSVQNEVPFQSVYRIVKPTGEIILVYEHGEPVYSRSGKLKLIKGYISDISAYNEAILHNVLQPEMEVCIEELEKICDESGLERRLDLPAVSVGEIEVLIHACRGMTMKEIAVLLTISNRTVETRFSQLRLKLGCHSKSQILDLFLKTRSGRAMVIKNILS